MIQTKQKLVLIAVILSSFSLFQANTFAKSHPKEIEFQACIDQEILNLEAKEPISNEDERVDRLKYYQKRDAAALCIRKIMAEDKDFSFCENDIILKINKEDTFKGHELSNKCYLWHIEDSNDQLQYFEYLKRNGLNTETCDKAYKKSDLSGDNCFYDLLEENHYSPHALCAAFHDSTAKKECKLLSKKEYEGTYSENFSTSHFKKLDPSIDSYQDCKKVQLKGFRDLCFSDFTYQSSKLTFGILGIMALVALILRWLFRQWEWRFIFTASFVTLAFVLFDLNTLWHYPLTYDSELLTSHFHILSPFTSEGCQVSKVEFKDLLFHSITFFVSLFMVMALLRKRKRWKQIVMLALYFLVLFGVTFFLAVATLGCG